jgi:hypothetical protein
MFSQVSALGVCLPEWPLTLGEYLVLGNDERSEWLCWGRAASFAYLLPLVQRFGQCLASSPCKVCEV